ncbi:hypothetical protein [Streptomyces sp. MJP52]|uniref:hypothetical protein n=1 Tax=Streptomyces sp. MJP52 TaxID=2940555 RepID=UPI002474C928|nr:hypothetical protein [Streptomyces sp. MJP52]MDH6226667.1 putative low-complexity protein [Streptomyces sp. MJP52]
MRGRWGAVAVAVAVLGPAGCSAGPSSHEVRARPAVESAGADARAAEPDAGEGTAASDADVDLDRRGNGRVEYPAGPAGEDLAVALSCRGDGVIEVRLPGVGASFSEDCREDEVVPYEHRLGVDGAERAGTAVVEAPQAVRWTVTVQRREPLAAR